MTIKIKNIYNFLKQEIEFAKLAKFEDLVIDIKNKK